MDLLAELPSVASATARLGTRFLIFPQPPFVPGYERPELIYVSTPLGEVGPGPSDRRMYVLAPLFGKEHYAFPYMPPFNGPVLAPAEPGPDGHFDGIEVGTPEFLAAHAYACTRRMLDICEGYLGHEVPWFFDATFTRLEIVARLGWPNSQSGYGYMEFGEIDAGDGAKPLALNFDVVAHEVAHLVLLGVLGLPRREPSAEFLSYQEAMADFLALIGLLHFDTALDRILRRTRGNLLVFNELDRFAEVSDERQIRVFSHALKAGDVGPEVHDFSRPFAGALFDSLIEIYQILLFDRGWSDLDPRVFPDLRKVLSPDALEREFSIADRGYEGRHFAVKGGLAEARDLLGECLVQSWRYLSPDDLTFRGAAEALVSAAGDGRANRFAASIHECFAWRRIL